MNFPNSCDIAIVGGGMAGLSAAASLSEMGIRNVVVFEASSISNMRGSSFGESRMYRQMYSDPVLCKLAKESNRLWAEQEETIALPTINHFSRGARWLGIAKKSHQKNNNRNNFKLNSIVLTIITTSIDVTRFIAQVLSEVMNSPGLFFS